MQTTETHPSSDAPKHIGQRQTPGILPLENRIRVGGAVFQPALDSPSVLRRAVSDLYVLTLANRFGCSSWHCNQGCIQFIL